MRLCAVRGGRRPLGKGLLEAGAGSWAFWEAPWQRARCQAPHSSRPCSAPGRGWQAGARSHDSGLQGRSPPEPAGCIWVARGARRLELCATQPTSNRRLQELGCAPSPISRPCLPRSFPAAPSSRPRCSSAPMALRRSWAWAPSMTTSAPRWMGCCPSSRRRSRRCGSGH